ncbi:MAG: tRNA (adenosine(37)-N6)-threonylcarbamoyltransferase complex dimerization subunit type 1 TsaB, partial [Elusimicrobiota bacterium]
LPAITEGKELVFFGNGAAKTKPVLISAGKFFIDDFQLKASHLRPEAWRLFQEGKFENLSILEPFYRKDFVAIKPAGKIRGL